MVKHCVEVDGQACTVMMLVSFSFLWTIIIIEPSKFGKLYNYRSNTELTVQQAICRNLFRVELLFMPSHNL